MSKRTAQRPKSQPVKPKSGKRPSSRKSKIAVSKRTAQDDFADVPSLDEIRQQSDGDEIVVHKRPDVPALLKANGITHDAILQEMRRIALSDVALMYGVDGEILNPDKMPEEIRRAISGFEVEVHTYTNKRGQENTKTYIRPKLWDKSGMLKELARMSSLSTDRINVGNAPGEKFDINSGPRESRADVIASLLSLIVPKKDPD